MGCDRWPPRLRSGAAGGRVLCAALRGGGRFPGLVERLEQQPSMAGGTIRGIRATCSDVWPASVQITGVAWPPMVTARPRAAPLAVPTRPGRWSCPRVTCRENGTYRPAEVSVMKRQMKGQMKGPGMKTTPATARVVVGVGPAHHADAAEPVGRCGAGDGADVEDEQGRGAWGGAAAGALPGAEGDEGAQADEHDGPADGRPGEPGEGGPVIAAGLRRRGRRAGRRGPGRPYGGGHHPLGRIGR